MQTEVIDRGRIRRYFNGSAGPIILIIAGLFTILLMIGFFLILGGIVWMLIEKFSGHHEVEEEIDRLIVIERNRLKEHGMKKLNLIGEQIDIIEPICLHGPSYDPNPIENVKKNTFSILNIFKKIFAKDNDPVWKSKIGSDGKLRYSLIEVNVFMFDEKQLYLYYAYLDITTGLIFHEGTFEYFYSDICGLNTNQVFIKVLNIKTKKFERKLFEYITVYTSGCSHKASMSTEINASILDQQFMAMRNLVRDKKMEMYMK